MTDQKDTSPKWLKSYPEGIAWDMEFKPSTLLQLFDDATAKYRDKTCIDFMGKKLTYGEVDALVSKTAKALQDSGVEKGARVGISMVNTPYYVVAFFAALKCGATVVNFNPLYTESEMEDQIRDSGTEYMFTLDLKQTYPAVKSAVDKGLLKKAIICKMSQTLPALKSTLFRLFKFRDVSCVKNSADITNFWNFIENDGNYKTVDVKPEDLAVLQYTGGTTGVPKGAMLSHFNLAANAEQGTAFINVKPGEEKMLVTIPFFHIFALTVGMTAAMKLGSEIIMMPNPRDIPATMKAIHAKKPEIFPAVPALYQGINNHQKKSKYDMTSIRLGLAGGAALPPDVKRAFEKISDCNLCEGYGLSETSPITHVNPPQGENVEGSIGLPVPGTEVKLIDPDDPSKDVSVGEVGEICIRGPQVMQGYWNKPEETAKVMLDGGWFRTGDLGKMDDNGYFYVVDRIKDLILKGGHNIYPTALEKVISEHPDIAECMVIGLPHKKLGEVPKAFLVLREDAPDNALESIKAHIKQEINEQDRPHDSYIEVVQDIPKTKVNKPDRREMKRRELQKQAPDLSGPQP